jgi:hypothetical protein
MTIPTEFAALRVVESLLLLLIEKNILPADEILTALDEVVAALLAQGKADQAQHLAAIVRSLERSQRRGIDPSP